MRVGSRNVQRSATLLARGAAVVAVGAVMVMAAGCGSPVAAPRARPVAVPVRVAPAHPKTRRPLWPRAGWISVPVATVWDKPALVRQVDKLAVAADPAVGRWLNGLDYPQRLDLDNRLATQALLDDPVTVESEGAGWAHVLIVDQRGSVYRHGIAGWVPASQITFKPPAATSLTAVVAQPVVRAGAVILSYGTRLPVAARSPGRVSVRTPAGVVTLSSGQARLAALPATGAQVVSEASRFLGLPYLWAGTSGFGLDCSGLTYLIYRQFGITLPRDAADQAAVGKPVAKDDLRPGDLIFFAFGPKIDHVGIYAGNGLMIDSPHTGSAVEVVSLWSPDYAPAYAGARRYLTGSA